MVITAREKSGLSFWFMLPGRLLPAQDIADQLFISLGTVKGHLNHILSKLGVRNRTEAAARGRELALLP